MADLPGGARHLLFFDGACGLCDRLVQWVLRRDSRGLFAFAALQSPQAGRVLAASGRDPARLDTVIVVAHAGTARERVLEKAPAILFILSVVGWPWRAAAIFGALPNFMLEPCYDFIARRRYKWFGAADACRTPDARTRGRFIDSP